MGSTYSPDTVLHSLQMTLTRLGNSTHFTDRETEALRGDLSPPRSCSKQVTELGFEPGTLALKVSPLLPSGVG